MSVLLHFTPDVERAGNSAQVAHYVAGGWQGPGGFSDPARRGRIQQRSSVTKTGKAAFPRVHRAQHCAGLDC